MAKSNVGTLSCIFASFCQIFGGLASTIIAAGKKKKKDKKRGKKSVIHHNLATGIFSLTGCKDWLLNLEMTTGAPNDWEKPCSPVALTMSTIIMLGQ